MHDSGLAKAAGRPYGHHGIGSNVRFLTKLRLVQSSVNQEFPKFVITDSHIPPPLD